MTFQIYVAFDVDHDQESCEEIQASSGRQGVFEVCGRTKAGAMTDDWIARTRGAIEKSDQVVVICSEFTDGCAPVAVELEMAREQERPFILLWSRREIMCTKPQGALATDTMFSWTPDILHQQLLANQRASLPVPIPRKAAPAPEPT